MTEREMKIDAKRKNDKREREGDKWSQENECQLAKEEKKKREL